ncbi:MAG: proprotein convertase P-domain-containing protein [Oligoflexales bacterium]
MKKPCTLYSLALASLLVSTAALGDKIATTYHEDYRTTPKLLTNLSEQPSEIGKSASEIATAYLMAHHREFGLPADLAGISLQEVNESLLGKHVHFKQNVSGTPVRYGEVVVSVDERTGMVFKVYNNYFPGQISSPLMPVISKEKALDIAWNDLRVHGTLAFAPQVELQYIVDGKGNFDLVYVTFLNVEKPFGAWEHTIDAVTGKIVAARDTRVTRKSDAPTDYKRYRGPIWDRNATTSSFWDREENRRKVSSNGVSAVGSGLVFDPDPRTTLNNANLMDESPAAEFEAAYFQKTLADITFANNAYELKGPWVTLIDFEAPFVAPSTTTTGTWDAKRGNVAFNDVMTYYHLDNNQKYMQSLGFKGNKAIQGASIEVDANGLSGQDNSHFIPASNRLAFGHGCVDDNEDSDVILHEYGHAINYSINRNWSGGDTGAMGEGFGDYWAGSYSLSTQNGSTYNSDYVFSWDGNPCWGGRRLNAVALQYNHSNIYGPHVPIPGGVTDELWSTPLFQSLKTAIAAGIPKEEIDTIILEAQFGLGGGLKMRDMANSIILTASKLYPKGSHTNIFLQKFAAHKIIEIPQAILASNGMSINGAGANNTVDPGETIDLFVLLKNKGTLPASDIFATMTSESDLVTVNSDQSTYNPLNLGEQQNNNSPFNVTIDPSFNCGDQVPLKLDVQFKDNGVKATTIDIDVPTGKPVDGMTKSSSPQRAIPDNNSAGIEEQLTIDDDLLVTSRFSIDMHLTHTFIGDLLIELVSPLGTKVILHKQSGGATANIVGNYPTTLAPAEALTKLVGQSLKGTWTLRVKDLQLGDFGTLVSWGINQGASSYECE